MCNVHRPPNWSDLLPLKLAGVFVVALFAYQLGRRDQEIADQSVFRVLHELSKPLPDEDGWDALEPADPLEL